MTPGAATTLPDVFSPEVIADPYPAYRQLRELGPVYDERNETWLISRHADVLAALREPRMLSSQRGIGALLSGQVGPPRLRPRGARLGLDQLGDARVLIATDPPDHTLLRQLVSRPFSPRAIAGWQPRVGALAEELVDGLVRRSHDGDADLVRDLAVPLPVTVIAEMLGIPTDRREDFRRWSNALVGGLAGIGDQDAVADVGEMFEYFWQLVEHRRAEPGEDLISAIAAATPQGERLPTVEVVLFCILLLVAGNETTTNLLGNGLVALWDHPEQARRLRNDHILAPAAIDEALRYDGPVQGLFRATTQPVVLGGVEIPEDQTVLVLFAAANRDPAAFSEPDRFVLERDNAAQVAFGHGIHYCLGAQLARLEVQAATQALLARVRRLEPSGQSVRTSNTILRGFTRLPVRATL